MVDKHIEKKSATETGGDKNLITKEQDEGNSIFNPPDENEINNNFMSFIDFNGFEEDNVKHPFGNEM